MKFHTIPKDEEELHDRSESCRCRPEVTMEFNADLGVMSTDVRHRTLWVKADGQEWYGVRVPTHITSPDMAEERRLAIQMSLATHVATLPKDEVWVIDEMHVTRDAAYKATLWCRKSGQRLLMRYENE